MTEPTTTISGRTFRFTTNHARSSYGVPVLVDEETGQAYGPNDILGSAPVYGPTPEWEEGDGFFGDILRAPQIGTKPVTAMYHLEAELADSAPPWNGGLPKIIKAWLTQTSV